MSDTHGDGDGTWRMHQQAAQLGRLFSEAGLSGGETLERVERLGRQLGARALLTAEVESISADIARRSSRGFDELNRLQDQTDVTERMARSVYDVLRAAALTDGAAAAAITDLLDDLQELHDSQPA